LCLILRMIKKFKIMSISFFVNKVVFVEFMIHDQVIKASLKKRHYCNISKITITKLSKGLFAEQKHRK
jgi:hypothetical protein